ncbi:DUF4083 domain-containing protein [Bacillus sp. AFS001701]|uniref:DUF4083 family protein n=1 Tax=Bacillaceae TaxID=186817 RepID=UPI000BF895F3|nr:DUF4083 family protein [Bacillus sp. AFS001701]PET63801.1 DUF4083 domain-containing protein [Bacillus sp. AFS001701]
MAIGDLIFQLIEFLIPVAIIILVVFIFRSIRKNRLQMERVEAKLDKINANLKKD